MAGAAGTVEALRGLGRARTLGVVDAMAGQAGEPAGALRETAGLAQAVGGADDLEAIAVILRGAIEEDCEAPQRIARPVRERAGVEPPDRSRQRETGRLQ